MFKANKVKISLLNRNNTQRIRYFIASQQIREPILRAVVVEVPYLTCILREPWRGACLSFADYHIRGSLAAGLDEPRPAELAFIG